MATAAILSRVSRHVGRRRQAITTAAWMPPRVQPSALLLGRSREHAIVSSIAPRFKSSSAIIDSRAAEGLAAARPWEASSEGPGVAVTKASYYNGSEELRSRVTIVRTKEEAAVAVAALYAASARGAVHACDTEVMDIDLSEVGPVGHGHVTCVSVFSGDDVDYGDGKGKALWVDNLDEADGVLQAMKGWFEDESQKKVWHNFGFDRHVMYNEGIDALGFGGDTMHMARLADSSRDKLTDGGAGYSLEALTADLVGIRKVPMKELFGVGKPLKDGTPSKVLVLPPIEDLQRGKVDPTHRRDFIKYSAFDAEGTWRLYQVLDAALKAMPWVPRADGKGSHDMREYYDRVLVPFGVTLTDMERRGIKVNAKDYLASVEVRARSDQERFLKEFVDWMVSVAGPDARFFNPQSAAQMQTLLFGGAQNQKKKDEFLPKERVVKVELGPSEVEALEALEARVGNLRRVALELGATITSPTQGGLFPPEAPATGSASAAAGGAPQTVVATGWASLGVASVEFASSLKLADLKAALKGLGIKVSGNKAELIDRVDAALRDKVVTGAVAAAATSTVAVKGVQAAAVTVPAAVEDQYSSMSTESLRDGARARNLRGSTDREALLRAIRCDDLYARALLHEYGKAPPAWVAPLPRAMPKAVAPPDVAPPPPMAQAETVAKSATFGHAAMVAPVLKGPSSTSEAEDVSREVAEATAAAVAAEVELQAKFGTVTGRSGGKRYREVTIRSLGMRPAKFTASGLPAVSMDVLRALAGKQLPSGELDEAKCGDAFKFFGGGEKGLAAARALDALCRMHSIDTMLSSFIEPLQRLPDASSRVHCSLNLNTETGRLSSRRPNLQNQPALEKDMYKIRDAFTCEAGNMLIVADYGQLELRLLAHMTDCKSMLSAFRDGGCFHSRTAVGMFDYVKKAVEKGEVLLEWDFSKGQPTAPLVKDKYGAERRKAKTLNFSIAYGKTPHGLSKDWGVSVKEAEALLEAWYADRPEVKAWQQRVIKEAKRTGATRTLCGRYRKLNEINSQQMGPRGHNERAAINTPIQGGAADIVMLAMNKINASPLLKRLGFVLLLQIHDEVILEGPEEHVKEALAEVRRCMEQPWDGSGIGLTGLQVSLDVDAKYAKTWYGAK